MEARSAPDLDSVRRLQARRRAARGLVAGYMHELSERHRRSRPGDREAKDRVSGMERDAEEAPA